ncbi:CBS domain-containing protein [Pseudoalteromonas peptidolytica]|uniref:CBS domain-containing protein n=1 Tax=Pseudoalteromonas peptidolytica F12-50-A1 TaxID=1315280 RepID=A0A8I0MTF0_9GAMM|nr:CBS domain-containing protein [Pseudoalteromonas peptidolytica]MBE0345381.1 hypothetical protein [Pseudoalteromonas peptidolytica F12-50-A1]NLR15926.1 CBS domain-containing protein [Pseudoalteromonas peptidolytica]GEK11543.1 hypothetical protein PPE03_37920 [Pseudoalteromonas peptidolytica]
MNTNTVIKTQPVFAYELAENHFPACGTDNLEQAPAHCLMHTLHLSLMQHIDENSSIDEAALVLTKTHRRASFVVDSQEKLVGMISNARLGSRYVLSMAEKRGCTRRDLTVNDVMIPLSELRQITLKQTSQAVVGKVLKTMEEAGHEFLLVIDDSTLYPVGYFDLIDLLKACGRAVNSIKPANKFSDIVGTILHHAEI